MFKVGGQLFTSEGPRAVTKLADLGFDIFLDLKFHDIPNTVAHAVANAVRLPRVRLMTLHAFGGLAVMRAAREAAGDEEEPPGAAGGDGAHKLRTGHASRDRDGRLAGIARGGSGALGEDGWDGWSGLLGAGGSGGAAGVRAKFQDSGAGGASSHDRDERSIARGDSGRRRSRRR